MADFDFSFGFATGEDATVEIEVTDDGGADLTGNSFEYCLYDASGATIRLLANAAIPRNSGALLIVIPRTVTSGMIPGARYSHNLWMMDGTYRRQVGSGSVTVVEGMPV
jgi:hypothetical protein